MDTPTPGNRATATALVANATAVAVAFGIPQIFVGQADGANLRQLTSTARTIGVRLGPNESLAAYLPIGLPQRLLRAGSLRRTMTTISTRIAPPEVGTGGAAASGAGASPPRRP